jgi:hypothetical protein
MAEQIIKFYMNNPCVVIREISDGEFCEIKLNPAFAQSMSGAEFCQGCILGPMDGAHPHHSCEELNELIDTINDQEASIIVLAETRLLHDKPVEMVAYSELEKRVRAKQSNVDELFAIATEQRLLANEFVAEQKRLDKQVDALTVKEERASKSLDCALRKLERARQDYADSLTVSSGTVSISGNELKQLHKDSFILGRLIAGGVDAWAWYSESCPSHEEAEDYASSMIEAGKPT